MITILHVLPSLAALYLILVFFHAWRSPFRSVPGPPAARCTDLWYLWRVSRGRFHYDTLDLHARYGPIVRYGPNRYSINHLDAVKIIYSPGSRMPKSAWYDTWSNPGQWTLFSDRSIEHHAKNKRAYQSAYNMSALVQYESYVDETADIFIQRLREKSGSSSNTSTEERTHDVVDLTHWFHCYAFDVIGQITYAERLGFLDKGEDIGGVIKTLSDYFHYSALTGIYSWLHPYLFPLRNYLAGEKGAGRQYMVSFTKSRMAHHAAAREKLADLPQNEQDINTRTECMLAKFIAKMEDDPENFTGFHVLGGCVSNMIAGSDTTGASLSSILYHLLRNPSCMQKLRAEIAEFYEQGELSEVPTFQEAQQMPYLQAVIKEALRIQPVAGLPLERVVPEGGVEIAGTFFPAGSVVGVSLWIEHYNPQYFGEDVGEFKPERWLTEDAEKLALMNRHWMPFGMGSRTCIGKNISLLGMTKLIPRLLRDFDFQFSGRPEECWELQNFWFVRPIGFKVMIGSRSS